MLPDDAAKAIAQMAGKMRIISLSCAETLDALNQTRKRGVRGGAVHDFPHAYAAELQGCEKIFTGNVSDFTPITKLPLEAP